MKESLALAATVVLGVLAWFVLSPMYSDGGVLAGGTGSVVSGARPTPRAADGAGPLGVAPMPPIEDGPFVFSQMQPGSDALPVAWDPCRFVHVVMNLRAAPAAAQLVVNEALAEMSRATGLQFTYEGTTDEAPSPERAAFQPDRYGDRWAPVLIAWSDPAEFPDLADDVAGTGGASRADDDGVYVYVSGQVVLDGPQVDEMLRARGGLAMARSVALHELGHLVGLNHVDSPSELMNARSDGSMIQFGPGDLRGLARLGSGPCVSSI